MKKTTTQNQAAAAIRRGEEAVKAAFAAIPRNADGVVRMAYDIAACRRAHKALAVSMPNNAAVSWFKTTINALQEREKEMERAIDQEIGALDKGEWYAQKPPLPAEIEFILAGAVERRREALYKASKAATPEDAPYEGAGSLHSWWSETHGADHDRVVARIADEKARRAKKAADAAAAIEAEKAQNLAPLLDGLPVITEEEDVSDIINACDASRVKTIGKQKYLLLGRNAEGAKVYMMSLGDPRWDPTEWNIYDGRCFTGYHGECSYESGEHAIALLEGGN